MRAELSLTYDAEMRPIAGKCSECGEQMPVPPGDPGDNVDTITGLSHHFLIHKRLKHPTPPARDAADDTDPFTR